MRVLDHVWNLRSKRCFRAVRRAFDGGRDRFGFRLTHYSVQGNHMHLIAEAKDRRALARGMQGLGIRIAKGLNRGMDKKGRVFSDRYHHRILRTPRQVRHALQYTLTNARRHGLTLRGNPPAWVDPYSSGPWFDGWKVPVQVAWDQVLGTGPPTAPPRTWLLDKGWRRHGLLDPAPSL